MRKTLLVAALIAAGAGGYYFWQQQKALPGAELLSAVPADTAVFSAQLQPVDLLSYLTSLGVSANSYSAASVAEFDNLAASASTPNEKFLFLLAKSWLTALQKPAELSQQTGIKAQLRSLFYLVGVAPVLKLELGDEARFLQMLDGIEQESGLKHISQQQDGQAYRVYPLMLGEVQLDLLVRTGDGWLTLALSSNKLPVAQLSEVLGTKQPADNLAASHSLVALQQKYQLNPGSFGYVSFAELSKPLTSTDGNRLAKDLNTLFAAQTGVAFADWRTPACQADVAAITKTLPGLYLSNQISADKVSGSFLLAIEHSAAIAALQQLQGYVPGLSSQGDLMLQLGLGLDVGQLSAGVGKLWDQVTTASYSCEPLLAMQTQLKQNNPLPMLMMAGMANGLQGIALTVNQLEYDPLQMTPKSVDALLTLSGDNLTALVESAKALRPDLAALTVPKAGETVDLTSQIPALQALGLSLNLLAGEKHLALYSGPVAAAQAKTQVAQALSKNGLLSVGFDYAKFFAVLEQTLAASGEALPPELAGLKDNSMRGSVLTAVTPNGIEVKSQIWLTPAQP